MVTLKNHPEDASNNRIVELGLPIGVGIAVIIVALLLRRIIYGRLHKWAAKTTTHWDDILIQETRIASLAWCFWLGIYAGIKLAEFPSEWAA
jgi:hypothetical protein